MIIENDIEKYLIKKCEKMGALCWKWTSPGRRGVPDRIVMYGGRVSFVELKAPGKKPRKDQLAIHAEIRKAGLFVYVIDSKQQVDDFLREAVV